MAWYVLSVEGVNFGTCLYDTNSLPVIRGASFLLDRVSDPVGSALAKVMGRSIAPDWAGGAKAVFRFDTDPVSAIRAEEAAREALRVAPWCHMTFVVDLVECCAENSPAARMIADARNRSRQLREWSVAPCDMPGAWRQDALDGMRPADPACCDTKGPLSPASAARLAFGRQMRHGFIAERIGAAGLDGVEMAESFADLVADPPPGLSASARSKMAVIHLDGDNFGRAAENAPDPAEFSRAIGAKLRDLLGALVRDALTQEAVERPNKPPRLRLEVLVWGGDDITLVVPAWRALNTFRAFYAAIDGWQVSGIPLSFTGGAVIASHKAPIRRMVQLATEAVGLAKAEGARGACTLDIFESASPPEDGLAAHRARIWGGIGARGLAFPGERLDALIKHLRRWRGEEGKLYPSRAALHRLVLRDLDEGALLAELARDAVRVLGDAPGEADTSGDDLRLPRLDGAERPLAADLRLICDLWDYAGAAA